MRATGSPCGFGNRNVVEFFGPAQTLDAETSGEPNCERGTSSSPPGPEAFSGLGMILTFEVEDAEAAHRGLVASGAPLVHPLTDEDWGQRRFMTRDPSGMLVDVVQQTEAKPEFWERYALPD